jgi:hypothetical protein
MSTGLLIANGTASVSYSYTAPADSRVIIAYAPTAVGQSITVNGVTMTGAVTGATVGGAVGGQWEIFLGAGQAITVAWPASNHMPAIVSCIEE